MSSRLPYASEAFETAAQSAETLARWEQEQLSHFQQRLKGAPRPDDLLGAAEAAIRCADAASAEKHLAQLLSRAPQEADAHYLQAMLRLGQSQEAEALNYLKQCTPKLKAKSPDHARLHALLAERLQVSSQDTAAAASTLKQAFELAGGLDFAHCTTRPAAEVTPAQLAFDQELFEAIWPWDQTPLQLRFSSVHSDSQGQVYITEQRRRWIFVFDATGRFVQGLTERDLAGSQLVFPEQGFDLTCAATDSLGQHYIAGQSDRIQVFSSDWQPLRQLTPPASQRSLRPLSIATDSQGNVFVLYLHLGGIHWFNAEGYHMGSFGQNSIMPTVGKNYFCGLSCTPEGDVALYDRSTVQIFAPGQDAPLARFELPQLKAEAFDDENYPFCWNGVAAGAGKILVCDTHGHQVLQLTRDGQSEALPNLTLKQPFDLALAPDDTLYIADTGQARILKIQNGTQQVLLGHPAFQGVV